MFSGIVEAMGTVIAAEAGNDGLRLVLGVPENLATLPLGSSLAVNGVCLTVAGAGAGRLEFDAVGATLARTALGELSAPTRVNLERSVRAGDPLDGHLVTGHVDGVGTVSGIRAGEGAVYMTFAAPDDLAAQIAPRGSIAVDGVSLTVASADGASFTVSVVPYTLEHTTLGSHRPGTRVHLETDILAKYVARHAQSHIAEYVANSVEKYLA